MAYTRLVHLQSGRIEQHSLNSMPPYVAVSHTWGDNLFNSQLPFRETPGRKALDTISTTEYRNIKYYWIDTLCIDQSDPMDKQRQIPLMGDIYGSAEVVSIVTKIPFGLSQTYIDSITTAVQDAIEMSMNETWLENGNKWRQSEKHRKLLKQAMDIIEVFTRPVWCTRVWTMQEFILAKRTLWIGSDLQPLRVEEIFFQAIPDVCDNLAIEECLGGKYRRIYSHLAGMAGAHLKMIEPTRVLELLGNKKATIPEDEVYGLMAASGVVLKQTNIVGKGKVWKLWWEEAIRTGHFRWAVLPPSIPDIPEPLHVQRNCIMPSFSTRHLASLNSVLDSVQPLGPVSVQNGTVSMMGRSVGRCNIIQRLGRIELDQTDGTVYRDITLILFSANNWQLALRIAAVFGAGRYRPKQRAIIAQVLVINFYRAKLAVLQHRERAFRPRFRNQLQATIWSDFMTVQMAFMCVMNDAIAFLADIRNGLAVTEAVVLTDREIPKGNFWAIDLGATNQSEKTMLTVIQAPSGTQAEALPLSSSDVPLHRIGVTTYAQLTSSLKHALYYSRHMIGPREPLQQFCIGGDACPICSNTPYVKSTDISAVDEGNSVEHKCSAELIQNTKLKMRRQMKMILVRVRAQRKAEYRKLLRRIGVKRFER
ncbi:MAG: hypothetical protein MMC33_009090 [Icmadophila ericetorum]|nr:hypothetical protein [Icmadophila ericetorum]